MSKKRLRHCPALGKEITSAECGENRLSRYDCPGDCEHNPFAVANYSELQELEDRFEGKLMRRVSEDPLASGRLKKLIMGETKRDELSFGPKLQWQLYHQKDRDGATMMDRWERDGYAGLRNDERVMAGAQRGIRPLLLEVLEVRDGRSTLAVDLLRPEEGRFLMVDRSFASMACRFDRFVCFGSSLPHYYRARGAIFSLPEVVGVEPVEVLKTLVGHLGGSLEPEWMFHNAGRLQEAATAVSRERMRRSMLASDMTVAEASYGLKESWKTTLGRLVAAGWLTDELTEEDEEEGFQMALLIPDETARPGGGGVGEAFQGSVLLKPGQARLSANSRAGLDGARTRFERIVGRKAEFQSEHVRDLAKQAALQWEAESPDLVPESLVKVERGLATFSSRVAVDEGVEVSSEAFMRSFYEGLLDQSIPLLGGLTPREAVADAEARPKVVEWAKGIVRGIDKDNLEKGRRQDANWLIRELGLKELDFPPPPAGRAPIGPAGDGEESYEIDDSGEEEWFGEEEDDKEGLPGFSMGEALPGEMQELLGGWKEDAGRTQYFEDRMRERLEEYDTALDALQAMEQSGCRLIGEMIDATKGHVGEEKFATGVVPMLLAWLALVPRGKRVVLEPGAARRQLKANIADLERRVLEKRDADDASGEVLRGCREPELLLLLWQRLLEANETMPRKQRLKQDEFFGLMLALVVAVNLLVEAME